MNSWLRLTVALAWVAVVLAQYYEFGGAWRMVPLMVAGVCHVIQLTEIRRHRKDDEHTTLNLAG